MPQIGNVKKTLIIEVILRTWKYLGHVQGDGKTFATVRQEESLP